MKMLPYIVPFFDVVFTYLLLCLIFFVTPLEGIVYIQSVGGDGAFFLKGMLSFYISYSMYMVHKEASLLMALREKDKGGEELF